MKRKGDIRDNIKIISSITKIENIYDFKLKNYIYYK